MVVMYFLVMRLLDSRICNEINYDIKNNNNDENKNDNDKFQPTQLSFNFYESQQSEGKDVGMYEIAVNLQF